jgi:peptide-methionine (S)-S-oxide reductase
MTIEDRPVRRMEALAKTVGASRILKAAIGWGFRFSKIWLSISLAIGVTLVAHNVYGQVRESSNDQRTRAQITNEKAVLAGGCFWGVDAVFKHVKGVISVTSGYSGGSATAAHYETVSTGTTGHAESVEIIFDPEEISYTQLLKVFFFVAHDPTELNRQGPDDGSQYRSAIFYTNKDQRLFADKLIKQLNEKKDFQTPIVTQVVPLKGFYPAEEYHQNFLERHPDNPYIVFNDMPKLAQLRKQFPDLYVP